MRKLFGCLLPTFFLWSRSVVPCAVPWSETESVFSLYPFPLWMKNYQFFSKSVWYTTVYSWQRKQSLDRDLKKKKLLILPNMVLFTFSTAFFLNCKKQKLCHLKEESFVLIRALQCCFDICAVQSQFCHRLSKPLQVLGSSFSWNTPLHPPVLMKKIKLDLMSCSSHGFDRI